MTIEKAIYQLTDLIKDRESFCHRDDFDNVFLQDIEACKMGIQALEKQIPKKVTNNGYDVYFCPACHGSVWQIRDESKYCFRCGQALDWSATLDWRAKKYRNAKNG